MVHDTTKPTTSATPLPPKRPRGRPRGVSDFGISRICGARFHDTIVSRMDRVLLHVFGLDIPLAARSELIRIAVEVGIAELEYRMHHGFAIDSTPLSALEDLPERSSRAGVLRAFRLPDGIQGVEALKRAEKRKRKVKREANRLGANLPQRR